MRQDKSWRNPALHPALVAPKPAGLDLGTPSPVSYRSIIGHSPASLRQRLRLQSACNGSLTLDLGTAFGSLGGGAPTLHWQQAHSLSLRSAETSCSPLTHCRWPPACAAREALGRCGFRCAATTAPVPVTDCRFPFGWDQKSPCLIPIYSTKLSSLITFAWYK